MWHINALLWLARLVFAWLILCSFLVFAPFSLFYISFHIFSSWFGSSSLGPHIVRSRYPRHTLWPQGPYKKVFSFSVHICSFLSHMQLSIFSNICRLFVSTHTFSAFLWRSGLHLYLLLPAGFFRYGRFGPALVPSVMPWIYALSGFSLAPPAPPPVLHPRVSQVAYNDWIRHSYQRNWSSDGATVTPNAIISFF